MFDQANDPNATEFLDSYIDSYGVPRKIRLNQVKCLVAYQVKYFCNEHNIDIFATPVKDSRAVGLVQFLIQTIKNRLECIKKEKNSNKPAPYRAYIENYRPPTTNM